MGVLLLTEILLVSVFLISNCCADFCIRQIFVSFFFWTRQLRGCYRKFFDLLVSCFRYLQPDDFPRVSECLCSLFLLFPEAYPLTRLLGRKLKEIVRQQENR